MTEDQILAATHDRMLTALDFYFPKEKAPRVAPPEASVAQPTPIKNGDERHEHQR
jgi:hypothetical protein